MFEAVQCSNSDAAFNNLQFKKKAGSKWLPWCQLNVKMKVEMADD